MTRRLIPILCLALVALWSFAGGWYVATGRRATRAEMRQLLGDWGGKSGTLRLAAKVADAPPAPRPTREPTSSLEETLQSAPLGLLLQAYERRLQELEQGTLQQELWIPTSAREREEHREVLYRQLQPGMQGDGRWQGQATINLGHPVKVEATLTALLFFFPSGADLLEMPEYAASIDRSKEVCWHLTIRLSGTGLPEGKRKTESTACIDRIAKKGSKYVFTLPVMALEGLARQYTHLSLEIPQGESAAELELLNPSSRQWISHGFSWHRVSRDEFENLRRSE